MGVCFILFVGLNLTLPMSVSLNVYIHSYISVFVQHVLL